MSAERNGSISAGERMYVPPVRQSGFRQPRGQPEDKGDPQEIAPGPRERRL